MFKMDEGSLAMKYVVTTNLTKMTLAQSLKKLMVVRPLNKITVHAIIQDCGLHRQTFYYHFKDIFDLVEWMFNQEIIVSLKENFTFELWDKGMYLLFSYIKNNEKICMCAFEGLGRAGLERLFSHDMQNIMRNFIDQLVYNLEVDEKYIEFISNFHLRAFAGQLIDWFQNGMNESPEEIVKMIESTVKGNIAVSLDRLTREQGDIEKGAVSLATP